MLFRMALSSFWFSDDASSGFILPPPASEQLLQTASESSSDWQIPTFLSSCSDANQNSSGLIFAKGEHHAGAV